MADSESGYGIKGKTEFEVLWAISGVYLGLVLVSGYFLIKTIIVPNCPAIFRQRFFHGTLSLASISKGHLVRIIWIYFYSFGVGEYWVCELLDILPNILTCLQASTISLLWFEIYLSSTLAMGQNKKFYLFVTGIVLYVCTNVIFIIFSFLVVFDSDGAWNLTHNKFIDLSILDSATNLCNTISITISGLLLSENAKRIFYGQVGAMISKRVNSISFFTSCMLIGKSFILIMNIAYESLLSDKRSNIE